MRMGGVRGRVVQPPQTSKRSARVLVDIAGLSVTVKFSDLRRIASKAFSSKAPSPGMKTLGKPVSQSQATRRARGEAQQKEEARARGHAPIGVLWSRLTCLLACFLFVAESWSLAKLPESYNIHVLLASMMLSINFFLTLSSSSLLKAYVPVHLQNVPVHRDHVQRNAQQISRGRGPL
jgi:hypothetical protein